MYCHLAYALPRLASLGVLPARGARRTQPARKAEETGAGVGTLPLIASRSAGTGPDERAITTATDFLRGQQYLRWPLTQVRVLGIAMTSAGDSALAGGLEPVRCGALTEVRGRARRSSSVTRHITGRRARAQVHALAGGTVGRAGLSWAPRTPPTRRNGTRPDSRRRPLEGPLLQHEQIDGGHL